MFTLTLQVCVGINYCWFMYVYSGVDHDKHKYKVAKTLFIQFMDRYVQLCGRIAVCVCVCVCVVCVCYVCVCVVCMCVSMCVYVCVCGNNISVLVDNTYPYLSSLDCILPSLPWFRKYSGPCWHQTLW